MRVVAMSGALKTRRPTPIINKATQNNNKM